MARPSYLDSVEVGENNYLFREIQLKKNFSIGTGTFELSEGLLNSTISSTARACLQIATENEQLSDEIKIFVLPFDKSLAPAYFRFNNPTPTAYYEYSARSVIQDGVRSRLGEAKEATQCAYAANALKRDNFPTSPEDLVALASLATLLHALVVAGYMHEVTAMSDIISNFILYEAASGEDGSFRKVTIATIAEQMGRKIHRMHKAYKEGYTDVLSEDLRSDGAILNGLMAFSDDLQGEVRPPDDLQTLSDYAAGAYYFLTTLRRSGRLELGEPRLRKLLRQLSSVLKMPAEVTQQFIAKMESLLELATLAALCEAGTVQALRGFKGLSYNGSLIRRIHSVLLSTSMEGVSSSIIEPIANMFAISIRMCNWSPFRDGAILSLLDAASTLSDEHWSLMNLALERYSMGMEEQVDTVHKPDVLFVCQSFLERCERAWATKASGMLTTSVENGWFGLLWKCIRGESLTSNSQIPFDANFFVSKEEAAFHQATQAGFPYILKKIVEGLGMDRCKNIVNQPNYRGQTPLHLACMHRAPKEVFRLLLILGADTNSQCRLGRTPLHYCFPNQSTLPSVYNAVMNMVSDHALPTTAPLDMPKAYGIYGKGKSIDPRVYDFRVIIHQLLCRNADLSIPDQEGMTSLHRAAKEGWGDNLDIFFLHDHGDAERQQRTCLKFRDDAGLTALDHARATGVKGALNGGEDVIVPEMRKRALDIPAKPAQHLLTLESQWVKMTIGKQNPPAPDPSPRVSVESPSKAVPEAFNEPTVTSSPQFPARFPPPQVYQDPEVISSVSYSDSSSNLQPRVDSPAIRNSWASSATPPPPVNYDSRNYQSMHQSVATTPEIAEPKQKSRFFKKLMKGK
jgi:ankyrin repeat protein